LEILTSRLRPASVENSSLLHELEEVAASETNRHMNVAVDWSPHEYVPWSRGRNFPGVFDDGEAWDQVQSRVSDLGRAALVVNLLTEDNLPSYHYEIATAFGRDSAWGTWVHRWTAEEGRHGIAIHGYLITSRAVDPHTLERLRIAHVSAGYASDHGHSTLHVLAYVAFQELATRISHRNAGLQSGDPVCERMLARIAADENLHMVFYRNLLAAAFEIAPDAAVQAVRDVVATFRMPGHGMPGFEHAAVRMAVGEIYNLRIHHDQVVQPIVRYLNALTVGSLGPDGTRAQHELGIHLEELHRQASLFDEKLAVRKARSIRDRPQAPS
jgi:acyl-[acyl-carrier-protein] desaturase